MAYMITIGFVVLFIALIGDLYERYLNHVDEINAERVITMEVDDMDYVELNGELIPYNEEDQE